MKIKRREALKAFVGGALLPVLPGVASRPQGELCDVCAVGEGCGAMYLTETADGFECPEDLEVQESMRPLEELFMRIYSR